MIRRLIVGLAVLSLAAATPAKPSASLRVSTHHEFIPFELTLTVELTGMKFEQVDTCFFRVDWSDKTPGGFTFNGKEEIPCAESPLLPPAGTKLTRVLKMEKPGNFTYRLILIPKEGELLSAITQDVRALRAPFEVKTRTHQALGALSGTP